MAAVRVARTVLPCSILALAAFAVSMPGSASAAAEKEVMLQNVQFDPKELTIAVGDSVKWTNKDAFGHDVTFEDGEKSGDPGSLASGRSWNRTFSKEGEYRYRCVAHSGSFDSGMTGKIIVKKESGGGGPAPAPPVSLGPLPPGAMAALGLGGISILISVLALVSPFREKSPYKEVDEEAVRVEVTRPKKK